MHRLPGDQLTAFLNGYGAASQGLYSVAFSNFLEVWRNLCLHVHISTRGTHGSGGGVSSPNTPRSPDGVPRARAAQQVPTLQT